MVIYTRILLTRIWDKWLNNQIMVNIGRLALGFLYSVTLGMYPYALSISVLVIIDMIVGIKASLKRGEPYQSKKLWRGLLQRSFLYTALVVSFIMLDIVCQHAIYNYGKYYIAAFACTLIAFYEASSIVEKLIQIFPNVPFLRRIGTALNLLDKKYEDSTVNQVAKILSNEK